jgi:hypothetical protein
MMGGDVTVTSEPGEGVGVYGAPAGRTRKIGSRLRAANPARRDVLFLLKAGGT